MSSLGTLDPIMLLFATLRSVSPGRSRPPATANGFQPITKHDALHQTKPIINHADLPPLQRLAISGD
jgi:hypothetical protein